MLFDPAVRILFTENIEKLGMASIYISFKNTFTPQKNLLAKKTPEKNGGKWFLERGEMIF